MDDKRAVSSVSPNVKVYEKAAGELAVAIRESLWIWDQAYVEYQPLVEHACHERLSYKEVEHLLDGLLNFAGAEANERQFRHVCQRYWRLYPDLVADYVYLYRDLYDSAEETDKK